MEQQNTYAIIMCKDEPEQIKQQMARKLDKLPENVARDKNY